MRRIAVLFAGFLVIALGVTPAQAVETNYQNPVTAAPPVSRPATASCAVTLMTHDFANSYGQPFVGTYTPPAACPGPWSKVVLDWTGSVAGRQFDRIAAVWIGGAEILRTSTPEPDPAGITWHVDKDVSEYAALFGQPQPVVVDLGNIVNSTYTGIYHITLTLTFYETGAQFPAAAHPDAVVPVSAATSDSAWFHLDDTSAKGSTVSLPTNLTRAYLEVYASGHSCDEFWYANQPDDYANANGLCGGTAFREIKVFVDGQLAGVAWPYPFIYTGGWNPLLWRPIPGVGAFNLPPYVVDLTPFVGTLTNGQPHTISLQVANDRYFWLADGNLLLYTDSGSSQTSGALTTAQIAPDANETVQENPTQNGGTFNTQASRSVTLSGYVDTSAGRITTTVHQSMSFSNSQVLNLVNFLETVNSQEQIMTTTTTVDPSGTTTTRTVTESYPLSGSSTFQIPRQQNGNEFILPADLHQALYRTTAVSVNGAATASSSLSDVIHAQAVLVRNLSTGGNKVAVGQTRQDYIQSDSTGACYNHHLAAAQGYVTADQLKTTCS